MKIDLYTKGVLTLIAVALTVIALNRWITPHRWLQALQPQHAEAQRGITVPKAWGKVVAYSGGGWNILFEAPDGSLRVVHPRKGLDTLIKRD